MLSPQASFLDLLLSLLPGSSPSIGAGLTARRGVRTLGEGGGGAALKLGLEGTEGRRVPPTQCPKDPGVRVPSLGGWGQEMKPGRTESETAQVGRLEGRKGALPHLDRVENKTDEHWTKNFTQGEICPPPNPCRLFS